MLRTPLEMQIAVRSCVPLNIYPPTWRWAVGSPVAGSSGTRTVRITHIWKGDVGVTSGRNGRSHTWVERTVSRNGRCFQSILCAFWACQLRVKTMVLSPSPLISHLLVIHLLIYEAFMLWCTVRARAPECRLLKIRSHSFCLRATWAEAAYLVSPHDSVSSL